MRLALATLAALAALVSTASAQETLPPKKTDNSQGNVRFLSPNAQVWSKAASKDGWTWYYVWLTEPDFCQLRIWDGVRLEGDFGKAFKAQVDKFVAGYGELKGTKGAKESTSREGFPVLQQTVEIEGKQGTVRAWIVGCNPGDRFELLAYVAGTEATWLKYAEDAKTFMTNLKFANVDEPAANPGKPGPNPDKPAANPDKPAAAGAYRVGDRVEILFGGTWYPGVVLAAGDGTWKVHYDDYGDEWDGWVAAEKLRPRAGGAAADPGPRAGPGGNDPAPRGDLQVGEMAEASWKEMWYEVKILAIDGGRVQVKWWQTAQVEWIERDRIRRKGEDKETLPPRADRRGNGGGLPPDQMVGKDVEVFWHGKWHAATVVKTDGRRLRVRYKTVLREVLTEEWAVPERVREVGGAVRFTVDPAKVAGRKAMKGLWLWILPGPGGSVSMRQMAFFEDGRVFDGPPPDGMEHVDWPVWQRMQPDHCGGYGVEGDVMHFDFGGDAAPWSDKKFEKVDANTFRLGGYRLQRALSFRAGEDLDGIWEFGSAGQSPLDEGKGHHAEHTVYRFHADGTYEYVETQAMTEGSPEAKAGGPGEGVGTSEDRHSGRYLLEAQTLTLAREGGAVERMSAFPTSDEDRDRIVIGNHLVVRRTGK